MANSKEKQIIDILKGTCLYEASLILKAVEQELNKVAVITPLPASSE